ncbi:MarR family transcriptional regulator [Rathayibacter sp. Leaf299]|uniref:MarR family transcriptional regulator n=1 Tax=Rathayibacter sp. Leaf299 TaxID=1736328 RepID=UPI0019101C95
MPGYPVRRLQSAYAVLWRESVGPEITGPQFALLSAVWDAPGADQITPAERIAVGRSTMADLARRMEDKGMMRRRTGHPVFEVNRSTSSVSRSMTPCSLMAPEPARAKAVPSSASSATRVISR